MHRFTRYSYSLAKYYIEIGTRLDRLTIVTHSHAWRQVTTRDGADGAPHCSQTHRKVEKERQDGPTLDRFDAVSLWRCILCVFLHLCRPRKVPDCIFIDTKASKFHQPKCDARRWRQAHGKDGNASRNIFFNSFIS